VNGMSTPFPVKSALPESLIQPLDQANQNLLSHVHPPDWSNPVGNGRYDLCVLGAGTAGLVSAVAAASLGARVALIEKSLFGGDCLNAGCVPSKALLRSAKLIGELRNAKALGVDTDGSTVNFGRIMERMRLRRSDLGQHDSVSRLVNLGVDVFLGEAEFTGRSTVQVKNQSLHFRRAIIATGSRPRIPEIPGLTETRYLTNKNLFWLTDLPRRLLVLGAGPVGCEMAQAFARFGSHVTVLDLAEQVLPREDRDAAALIQRQLSADGVQFKLNAAIQKVVHHDAEIQVHFQQSGISKEACGDQFLIAGGREANIESLNLKVAGVVHGESGVVVNDQLRTTNRRIYAAGDVCSTFRFTHVADAMARVAIQNALFYGRKKVSTLVIPSCTYTDPEIAHVGLNSEEASARGHRVESLTVPLAEVDRAVLDEMTDGFVRVHHENGRLLGCTIVATHANEMIGEATYAISQHGTLSDISNTIHPYPTQIEALRKAGDAYRRSLITPRLKRWLRRYFVWSRRW